jgi:hypothetical protein
MISAAKFYDDIAVSNYRCIDASKLRQHMHLRGALSREEFHLAAIVQNPKTLANHIWRPMMHDPVACVM